MTRIVAALIFLIAACGQACAAPAGWVLALSWQPGFCAVNPRAADCAVTTGPRLVLHGLWPDGDGREFCDVPAGIRELDNRRRWCRLPEPALSPQTRGDLARVMPSTAACLERHEWARHGSCADLPAEQYYGRAIALTDAANRLALAEHLRRTAGGEITIAQLRALAARDFGEDGTRAMVAVCAQRGDRIHLVELRFSLTEDGVQTFPERRSLRLSGVRAGQRCPVNRPVRLD